MIGHHLTNGRRHWELVKPSIIVSNSRFGYFSIYLIDKSVAYGVASFLDNFERNYSSPSIDLKIFTGRLFIGNFEGEGKGKNQFSRGRFDPFPASLSTTCHAG